GDTCSAHVGLPGKRIRLSGLASAGSFTIVGGSPECLSTKTFSGDRISCVMTNAVAYHGETVHPGSGLIVIQRFEGATSFQVAPVTVSSNGGAGSGGQTSTFDWNSHSCSDEAKGCKAV